MLIIITKIVLLIFCIIVGAAAGMGLEQNKRTGNKDKVVVKICFVVSILFGLLVVFL